MLLEWSPGAEPHWALSIHVCLCLLLFSQYPDGQAGTSTLHFTPVLHALEHRRKKEKDQGNQELDKHEGPELPLYSTVHSAGVGTGMALYKVGRQTPDISYSFLRATEKFRRWIQMPVAQ